jgi:hypothetical protein
MGLNVTIGALFQTRVHMLQVLISVARATMAIGVALTVVVGGIIGLAISQEMGAPRLIGFALGAALGLIFSSVSFGVAAAIFDIQEQTRVMVRLLRNQSTGLNALERTAPEKLSVAGAEPSPEPEIFVARFPEGPEGWRLLTLEAESRGWKVSSGLSGVSFTNKESGDRMRFHTVREAELGLKLKPA